MAMYFVFYMLYLVVAVSYFLSEGIRYKGEFLKNLLGYSFLSIVAFIVVGIFIRLVADCIEDNNTSENFGTLYGVSFPFLFAFFANRRAHRNWIEPYVNSTKVYSYFFFLLASTVSGFLMFFMFIVAMSVF